MKSSLLPCAALLAIAISGFAIDETPEPVKPPGAVARIKISSEVEVVTLSTDGKLAAIVNKDKDVLVWDLERFESRKLGGIPSAENPISLAISPDGKHVACGTAGGGLAWTSTIVIWETAGFKMVHSIPTDSRMINELVFAPDSKALIAGGFNLTHAACEFDVATGKEVKSYFGSDTDAFSPVDISPDGKRVAVGGYDSQIRIYERGSSKVLHKFPGYACTLLFTSDAQLTTNLANESLVKWNLQNETREPPVNHHNHLTGMAYSRNGRYALCQGEGNLIDLRDGSEAFTEQPHVTMYASVGSSQVVPNPIRACAFSADSTRFLTGRTDGTLTVWSIEALSKK